jgi:hypothetical protein
VDEDEDQSFQALQHVIDLPLIYITEFHARRVLSIASSLAVLD